MRTCIYSSVIELEQIELIMRAMDLQLWVRTVKTMLHHVILPLL